MPRLTSVPAGAITAVDQLAGLLAARSPQPGLEHGVELEIGSGNGDFLLQRCLARPDRLVIGTELKLERCRKCARKLQRAGADNGLIVRGPAEQSLLHLAPASLTTVHIYFPDPWPKTRHRRRRFLRRPLLAALVDRLVDGGEIRFVTDFFDYHLQAAVLFALDHRLTVHREPGFDDLDLSRYGPRLVALGKDIQFLRAVRTPSSDAR